MGTVTITGSTFIGNTGTYPGIIVSSGSGSITNTTFTGNTATNAIGDITVGAATLAIVNVTATGSSQKALYVGHAGANVTVSNSILQGGTAACDITAGTLTSSGYNILRDGTCAAQFNAAGDALNTDPLLGALASNGGQTQTLALQTGSPAVDAGNCNGGAVTTDQRGTSRPQGSACDIGAYEANQYAVNVTVVGTGSVADDAGLAGFGIACGATCNDYVLSGQSVTLTATPGAGQTFSGWAGACSGRGDCLLSNIAAAKNVTATFHAVAPNMGASATNVAFGSVPLGGSGSGSATLVNNGNGSIAITGLSPVAAPFTIIDDGCTGKALHASGGSCAIEFRFDPTASGSFNATVNASTNYAPVTITLSGTGTGVPGSPITPATLIAPADGATVPPGAVTFEWTPGGGSDELLVCDNVDFTGCSAQAQATFPTGLILVGLLIPFGLRSRAGRTALMALLIVAGGLTACGSSSNGTTNSTALKTSTLTGGTYYWKVVTTSGSASAESEIRSLTVE